MRGAPLIGRLGLVLELGCLSISFGGVARAAEIVAQGPSECPDSAELGFRVERNVGVPLARAPAVKFVVEMQRSAGTYAARLSATGDGDTEAKERALTGADCGELADAVVVAITLALGEAAAAPAPAAPPIETAPALPVAARASEVASNVAVSDAPQTSEPAHADGLRPSLSLGVLVDAGSLPDPGLGAAIGVALSWERVQLRALGTILFEQHTEVGGAPPAPGADLQLFAGSLHGCTTAIGGGERGFLVPVCLGFELGRISGTGTGVVAPRSGSALWAAPRADVGAHWCLPTSPLCLGATLTAAAPLTRSRFTLTEIGTIYRPSPVVGRLSLGIGVGFD
jgi:hypothetical protein